MSTPTVLRCLRSSFLHHVLLLVCTHLPYRLDVSAHHSSCSLMLHSAGRRYAKVTKAGVGHLADCRYVRCSGCCAVQLGLSPTFRDSMSVRLQESRRPTSRRLVCHPCFGTSYGAHFKFQGVEEVVDTCVCVCVSVYVYVCMYVCVYVCMYVCMYV